MKSSNYYVQVHFAIDSRSIFQKNKKEHVSRSRDESNVDDVQLKDADLA